MKASTNEFNLSLVGTLNKTNDTLEEISDAISNIECTGGGYYPPPDDVRKEQRLTISNTATSDGYIVIAGVTIEISAGDTPSDIAQKIVDHFKNNPDDRFISVDISSVDGQVVFVSAVPLDKIDLDVIDLGTWQWSLL